MSPIGLFKTTVKVEQERCVCVCVCVCVRVHMSQSHLTLCDPIDYSLPGFSVYGISQARMLEQVTISYPRGSFLPRESNLHLLRLLHWQADSLQLCRKYSTINATC